MRTKEIGLCLIFALTLASGAGAASGEAGPGAPPKPMSPAAFGEATGISVTLIGVTAAGGLVDFRFKVLDAAKARMRLADPKSPPVLLAADLPPLTPTLDALRFMRFEAGRILSILYPNVRNAVKPGTPVTVVVGDVRLEPMKAQ